MGTQKGLCVSGKLPEGRRSGTGACALGAKGYSMKGILFGHTQWNAFIG